MRSLVIGASGLLGEALMRTAPSGQACIGTSHRQSVNGLVSLNITNPDAVQQLVADTQPEVVLLCAANPNVDLCEREPELTRATNVVGVENVAKACAAAGVKLVFYSSDYVFDGKDGPYTEDATANPICAYGRQKLEAEATVHSESSDNLVLRITGVYGQERQGKNFVYRAISTLKNRQALRVPEDQYGNPTLSDDLAAATWELVSRHARGVLHLAGSDCLNRLEFAQLIANVFQQPGEFIQGLSTAELGQVAPRPLRAGLISVQSATLLERALLSAEVGLRRLSKTGVLNG